MDQDQSPDRVLSDQEKILNSVGVSAEVSARVSTWGIVGKDGRQKRFTFPPDYITPD